MRALLVDSAKQEIREVEYESTEAKGTTLQQHIGGYIETAYAWPNGDILFVDEEGLFKAQKHFFRIGERPDQPFAGHGIVVGPERLDEDGEYLGTDAPIIHAGSAASDGGIPQSRSDRCLGQGQCERCCGGGVLRRR